MDFKDVLAEEKEERGLTQYELAEIIGVSPPAVSRYLAGSPPSYEVLKRTMEKLNRPIFQVGCRDGPVHERDLRDYLSRFAFLDEGDIEDVMVLVKSKASRNRKTMGRIAAGE